MKKVVLIEDSKTLAGALVGVLELEGLQTVWAADGVQGVAAVRREKPDLVLLDLMLPKLSGFEVCKMLKTGEATWRIPVVIMSTLTDSESKLRAQEAGADYFIGKPYDLAATVAEIKKYLKI